MSFFVLYFIKRRVLVFKGTPKSDFEFGRISVELSVSEIAKNWLPAVTDSGE
jgi:hypothetical protein